MGLLDHLWDDTVAGPRPDSGLGKLRKHSTFSARSNSGKEVENSNIQSLGGEAADDATRVTRSIMIVKPLQASLQKDSPPVSPAGSTPPVSPFGGGREAFRFRRGSGSFSFEKASGVGPRSPPPPYDL
ncbi:dormancy-associated protein homolog 3 isoform X2 [Salvia miltiorrhiza]|uniref:dormancy-associated protein homolog 3 isoform X2 n=1 Tax=Salvia miltiorrhiza TaxID=226208 RepID=UPI0025ABE36B|nr:dormancy-associated protein homolog 3 isoform X2 [Salvia miltiorrhiza]